MNTPLPFCSALLIILFPLFVGCGGGGSSSSTESTPEELNTTMTTVALDASGGEVVVSYDDELIPGATLTVPDGAVDAEVTFSIQAEPEGTEPSTLKEAAETEETFHRSLVDYAIDNVESSYIHPMYGPLLLISTGSFAGPGVRFGPANQTFNSPVTASIPLDVLSIESDDRVIAVLQSQDGTWETLPANINASTSNVDTQVAHFSSLRFVSYFDIFSGQGFVNLGRDLSEIISGVQHANENVLPKDTFEQFLNVIVCASVPIATNLDSVIGEWDLLDELLIGSGPDAGDTTTLYNWIKDQYGNVPDNSISFAQLFGKALEIENGNIYKALATTNAVLSANRKSPYIDKVVENFRGDGGDETGARYHFFGAALHAFVHEYHRDNSWIYENSIFDPEAMVTIEEHVVSGDIFSDTTEYAVDLKGVELGRQLYRAVQGKSKEELMREFNISENSCRNSTGACPSVGIPQSNSPSCPTTYDRSLGSKAGYRQRITMTNPNDTTSYTACDYGHGALYSDPEGILDSEEYYVNSKKHGISRGWYESGQLRSQTYYKNGNSHYMGQSWYESGQIKQDSYYIDGNKCGTISAWFESGQIKDEEHFVDGSRHGTDKRWLETGELAGCINYENGINVGSCMP